MCILGTYFFCDVVLKGGVRNQKYTGKYTHIIDTHKTDPMIATKCYLIS